MEIDPWSGITPTLIDAKLQTINSFKTQLIGCEDDVVSQVCYCCATGDVEELKELLLLDTVDVNSKDANGMTCLMYACVYGFDDCVGVVLKEHGVDVDVVDGGVFGWNALRYAVYFENCECVRLLLREGADPSGVIDVVKRGSIVESVLNEFGIERDEDGNENDGDDDDDDDNNDDDNDEGDGNGFYKENKLLPVNNDDELIDNIRLQTAVVALDGDVNDDDGIYQDDKKFNKDEEERIPVKEFNFQLCLKGEYIVFSDYDISQILELIMKMPSIYQHEVRIPAGIIYQCVRYLEHVKQDYELVDNFMNLTFNKIRSMTSIKTGVVNELHDGDILQQSYWIGVVNFVYYYLIRDDGFFPKHEDVLKELKITLNSLIIELTNCIKFKLLQLLESCFIKYENLHSLEYYKSDWNFFKKSKSKSKSSISTYEEIHKMLYPPSLEQQIKPNPIKVVQTMGALLYVLELHDIHNSFQSQICSIIFQFLNKEIFNSVLKDKKLMSRAKAIQLRLNISILEDWTRKFGQLELSSRFHKEMTSSLQLLQWLQCLSSIDEIGINNFTHLNDLTLIRCCDKYRYEMDETKIDKSLYKKLVSRSKTDNQDCGLSYDRKNMIFINDFIQFELELPDNMSLIDAYVDHKYQPWLPINVLDMIEEIHEQNEDDGGETRGKDELFKTLREPEGVWENPWG